MEQMEYRALTSDSVLPHFHIASPNMTLMLPVQSTQVGQLSGSGRSGGGPAAGQPAAAQPAEQPADPLFGCAPQNFDGSRDKIDDFLQAFGLYRAINRLHPVIAMPYNRIMLCLSYMKGFKINDWVRQKATALQTAIDNGMADPNDEAIWTAFEQEFRAAFTDTTRREQATQDLINIQMKGEDLDTYIATFDHLRKRAGWEPDAQGTILLFRRGLNALLTRAIVNQTHLPPRTLAEWFTAARAQHAAYTENKATLTNPFLRNDTRTRWEQTLGRNGGSSGGRQGGGRSNAMDAEVARMMPLSDEERKKLQAAGRCFFCKAQGHMWRKCPKKKGRSGAPKPPGAKARAGAQTGVLQTSSP
jgi:Retrotransposon gag protein